MNAKKVVTMVLASVMAIGVFAAPASAEVILKYSETNSMDSTDGKYAQFFKDKVAELTDGEVVIDVQASGVLGTEADVLDGMVSMSGTVDIVRMSCYAFSNYGCNKSALLGLPFIFESSDHFWNFAHSEVGQEILNEPAENNLGVTGLFYLEDGFRSFFFTKPVEGIDDLKDKKLRVSSDQIMTGLCKGLGASATVVNFNELYTSLQSGVVDGAEQPITPYASNAFNEVAPYMLLDEHTMATSSVVIADMSLDKLTPEQQDALFEAGKATEEYARELCKEDIENCMKELEEKGVTFIEVPDKTPYREACADLIAQFTSGIEDTYQAILDLA
ncbi:MAG: TRAP transporter substrate-binding protein [Blautia sp.]|nr:TRAP transporter substrate-binding protein [Blautia sp.]